MSSHSTSSAASLPALPTARAHLRHATLEVAAQVMAQNAQASIDDIAQASGVARATLYRWFSTRDQLIEAILHQILAEAHEIARAAFDERDAPPLAVLQGVNREFLSLGERYRFMETKLETVAGHEHEHELREQFTSYVRGAQERGALRGDLPPEWIAATMGGTVLAACKEVRAERLSRRQAEELMDRTAALLLNPDAS